MSLLNTIMDNVSGKAEGTTQPNPLVSVLGNLLTQSGGLQGLMGKFSQAGLGGVFSSWVGTGANQPISPEQIQKVLGPGEVNALAAKLGIDPAQASQFIAEHLPKVIDQLTPAGNIDPNTNIQQKLAGLVPGLLQKFTAPAAGAR